MTIRFPSRFLAPAAYTLGGVGVVAAAVFAATTPAPRPPPRPAAPAPAPAPEPEVAALNLAAFAARLWTEPPHSTSPPAAPAPPAPLAPLRLRLVGIIRSPGGESGSDRLRAALYDPEGDRLHIVAAGEAVGLWTVGAVEPGGVELRGGGASHRLALGPPAPARLEDLVRGGKP